MACSRVFELTHKLPVGSVNMIEHPVSYFNESRTLVANPGLAASIAASAAASAASSTAIMSTDSAPPAGVGVSDMSSADMDALLHDDMDGDSDSAP
jgi:hypothetical protein